MITNPTLQNFKEFIGPDSNVRRSANFLVFSKYINMNDDRVYYGVMKNFLYFISQRDLDEAEKARADSTKAANDAAKAAREAEMQDSIAKIQSLHNRHY